jgi:hypothetical protein
MAFKVMFDWFKKRGSGNSVSARYNSVGIGRDNNGTIIIYQVHNGVRTSEPPVDIKTYLVRQSQRQLNYEKHSGKYIPDIFIETRETKNLIRTFTHPTLFFRRTLDSLGRANVPGINRFLNKAGLPPLPFPDLKTYYSKNTLAEVNAIAAQLSTELAKTAEQLETYQNGARIQPPPFSVKPECEPFFKENKYHLETFGWRLIRDQLKELNAVQAKVFILTGRAGQGKTNLVCDFVENFLLKHEIPCAYLSGRKISAVNATDLGETIQHLIFEGATNSFSEAAKLLSAHATETNKPFVLVIDGLNEHHRIIEFSAQLEHFIETVIEYSNIKLLLTCRSEFFHQRFGNIIKEPLAAYTFVEESHEHRRDRERYDEILQGYFAFFKIRPELVSEQVIESLKSDILLLRFFCEAYGARNKSMDYRQPQINNIYREQIFKIYLEKKLGTADIFMRRITSEVNPKSSTLNLVAVLECAVKNMLEQWQFSDVPISAIPENLNAALYALLDEELVIRRDAAPSAPSVFSPTEETINFTFDEFRDYLLAQYLLYRVYGTDITAFNEYIARNNPKDSQIIEGTKRFLFYASRHPENEAFWIFYRDQSWYMDVYHEEVFNIDSKLLQVDDCDLIIKALQAGNRMMARKLAVRWHPSRYPLLNLELFLSYVTQTNDAQFDNLIMATFRSHQYGNDGSSSEAFCEFISEKVLPTFTPIAKAPENGLFQFLILLLPVDGNSYLESGCMGIYRKLLDAHPSYAIGLLHESLQHKPTLHKPYVWRLLTEYSQHLSINNPLIIEAKQVLLRNRSEHSVLNREVGRFLKRFETSVSTDVL